jgi:tRNA1(Val) A37 N6-methylase TrmN6
MIADSSAKTARQEVSEDAFLGGSLKVLQPRRGYRAGIDAVLLAAAAPAEADESQRVLDSGAGVGVVGLCIAARVPRVRVTLVEREPELAALAASNVTSNGLSDRIAVVQADLTAPAAALARLGLEEGAFAHIVTNPPFREEGKARPPKDRGEAVAHIMPCGALERWLRALARLAAPGGSLTMIHRPEALPELLAGLDGRFGSLMVLPIHPRPGKPALRVILQGRKGSRGPLTLLPGLVLHGEGSAFTPEVAGVLRSGRALPLGKGR